jgi:hypothetical protein
MLNMNADYTSQVDVASTSQKSPIPLDQEESFSPVAFTPTEGPFTTPKVKRRSERRSKRDPDLAKWRAALKAKNQSKAQRRHQDTFDEVAARMDRLVSNQKPGRPVHDTTWHLPYVKPQVVDHTKRLSSPVVSLYPETNECLHLAPWEALPLERQEELRTMSNLPVSTPSPWDEIHAKVKSTPRVPQGRPKEEVRFGFATLHRHTTLPLKVFNAKTTNYFRSTVLVFLRDKQKVTWLANPLLAPSLEALIRLLDYRRTGANRLYMNSAMTQLVHGRISSLRENLGPQAFAALVREAKIGSIVMTYGLPGPQGSGPLLTWPDKDEDQSVLIEQTYKDLENARLQKRQRFADTRYAQGGGAHVVDDDVAPYEVPPRPPTTELERMLSLSEMSLEMAFPRGDNLVEMMQENCPAMMRIVALLYVLRSTAGKHDVWLAAIISYLSADELKTMSSYVHMFLGSMFPDTFSFQSGEGENSFINQLLFSPIAALEKTTLFRSAWELFGAFSVHGILKSLGIVALSSHVKHFLDFCTPMLRKQPGGEDPVDTFLGRIFRFAKLCLTTIYDCVANRSLSPLFSSALTYHEWIDWTNSLLLDTSLLFEPGNPAGTQEFERKLAAGEFSHRIHTQMTKPDLINQLQLAVDEGLSLATKHEKDSTLYNSILRHTEFIKRERIAMTLETPHGAFRIQPFGLLLVGTAGTGKSRACHDLHMACSLKSGHRSDPSGVLRVDSSTNFADGAMRGQSTVLFDDVDSKLADVTAGHDDHVSLVNKYINVTPFNIEQASLEKKGKVWAGFSLALYTTNFDDCRLSGYTQHPAMFWRRFPYRLRLKVRPQYATATGAIDETKVPTEGHYELHDYILEKFDPVKLTIHKDYDAPYTHFETYTTKASFFAAITQIYLEFFLRQKRTAEKANAVQGECCKVCCLPLGEHEDCAPCASLSLEMFPAPDLNYALREGQREGTAALTSTNPPTKVELRGKIYDSYTLLINGEEKEHLFPEGTKITPEQLAHFTSQDSSTAFSKILMPAFALGLAYRAWTHPGPKTFPHTFAPRPYWSWVTDVQPFRFDAPILCFWYAPLAWLYVHQLWFATTLAPLFILGQFLTPSTRTLERGLRRRLPRVEDLFYALLVEPFIMIYQSLLPHRVFAKIVKAYESAQLYRKLRDWFSGVTPAQILMVMSGVGVAATAYRFWRSHSPEALAYQAYQDYRRPPGVPVGETAYKRVVQDEELLKAFGTRLTPTTFTAEEMAKKISERMITVRTSTGVVRGFRIAGSLVVCNSHIFMDCKATPTGVTLTKGGAPRLTDVLDLPAYLSTGQESYRIEHPKQQMFRLAGKDLVILHVPSLPPFSSKWDFPNLLSEYDPTAQNMADEAWLCLERGLQHCEGRTEAIRAQDDPNGPRLWAYRTPTLNGDCGSILIIRRGATLSIAGLHTGSYPTGNAVAEPLSRADYSRALEYFKSYGPSLELMLDPKQLLGHGELKPLEPLPPKSSLRCALSDEEEIPEVTVFGTLPGLGGSSMRSRVVDTIFRKHECVVKLEEQFGSYPYFAAPIFSGSLDPNGKWVDPHTLSLSVTKNIGGCRETWQLALNDYLEGASERIQMGPLVPFDDYSAFFGVPDTVIGGTNMASSAGPPFYARKSSIIRVDHLSDPKVLEWDAGFQSHLTYIEDTLRSGNLYSPFCLHVLKDEVTTVEKNLKHKVRVFNILPFAFNHLLKRYLGPLVALLREHALFFETAVGFNICDAGVAEMLYSHVAQFDVKRCIAFDKSSFDARCSTEEHLVVCQFFERLARLAGYSEDDCGMVFRLCLSSIYPVRSIKGDLFMLASSMPTGFWMTIHFNCVRSSLQSRYAWFALNRNAPRFRSYVSQLVLGDDLVATVAGAVGFYNQQTVAQVLSEIGAVTTSFRKGTDLLPFEHLSEVEFLKRRPRLVAGHRVWALSQKTLAKMLCMRTRSASVPELDAHAMLLTNVLAEVWMWGEDDFYCMQQIVKRLALRYGLDTNVYFRCHEFGDYVAQFLKGSLVTWDNMTGLANHEMPSDVSVDQQLTGLQAFNAQKLSSST